MESREDQIERETRWIRAFQREADEISRLILNTDLPWIDIEIRINRVRQEARYRRLWSQFRTGTGDEPHAGNGPQGSEP